MGFASRSIIASVVLAALIAAVPPGVSATPGATLFVNDNGAAGPNLDCARPFSNTIAAALAAANPGDTVHVCAGTYDEQLSLAQSDLTVEGDGAGVTILKPTTVTWFPRPGTGSLIAALFLVRDATGVTVRDLTVDGGLLTFPPTCPPFEFGILYLEASGTVRGVHVTDLLQLPLSECGVGIALLARLVPSVLEVTESRVSLYNNALRCTGRFAACEMTDNVLRGVGPTDERLEGGILVTSGAFADIHDNVIADHFYTPKGDIFCCTSVGIALFNVDPRMNGHLLERNTFSGNELNVQRYSTAAAIFH